MGYRSERARQEKCTAAQMLRNKFREVGCSGGVSAQYVRFGMAPIVIGVSGLKFDSMLISVIAEDDEVFAKLSECAANGYSVMFVNGGGKISAAKEHGWLRSEGKEYEVKDGDICHFLFNV